MHKENVINNESDMSYIHKNKFLKTILIIFSILLLLIILASFLLYIYVFNKQKIIISENTQAVKNDEQIIEYGTNLTYQQIKEKLVNNNNKSNIKIYIQDILINEDESYLFNELNNNIIINVEFSTPLLPFLNSLSFLNHDVIYDEQIIWKVEDTKMPILSGVQDKEIIEGENFDVKSGISARDEIDGELDVIVEGNFNSNKVGTYALTAKAIDKNKNETKQKFKVTVKAKTKNNLTSDFNKNTTTSAKKTNTNNNKATDLSNSNNKTSNSKNSKTESSKTSSSSTKAGRLALAKAEAKRVIKKIIKSNMTKEKKAEAICYYITNTVSVQQNQSSEAYKTNYGNEAYAALILKKAACSGRCKAVTLLCDAAGLKSKHINANQWTHQWNKVQIDDGSWLVIDSQIGFVGKKHPLE